MRLSRRAPLPRLLAVRQLARRSGTTRSTALVTATVTFVGFAVAAWVVAREQRGTEAEVAVGAARVVAVDPVPPTELLDAVRAVDPGGRAAMAAVQVAGDRDSGVQRLLAVELRLARQPGRIGGVVGSTRLRALTVDGRVVDRFAPRRLAGDPRRRGPAGVERHPARRGAGAGGGGPAGPLRRLAVGLPRHRAARRAAGAQRRARCGHAGAPGRGRGPPRRGERREATPSLRAVERTAVLPRLGTEGLLVDLGVVERFAPLRRAGAQAQVWLSEDAPAGTVDALRGGPGGARRGTTVVVVTHDPTVAARWDRALTIRDGRVGAEGRFGRDRAVVGPDGALQLRDVRGAWPPGTRVEVVPDGDELRLRREAQ